MIVFSSIVLLLLSRLSNATTRRQHEEHHANQHPMLRALQATGGIKGNIDSVRQTTSGSTVISGWACQEGVAAPIDLHLYATKSAYQGGTFVRASSIERYSSETAVANICQTSFSEYRFKITLDDISPSAAGQALFVHGIRKVGTVRNEAIRNSGRFSFPHRQALLSDFPQNQDLEIPRYTDVKIDTPLATFKLITIRGALLCNSGDQPRSEIRTEGIVVTGPGALFQCGADPSSWGNLKVTLTGQRDSGAGTKAIVVENGGTVRWHGKSGKEGYTKLLATVQAGNTSIRVAYSPGWQIGDKIVIGATDYDFREAEERVIENITVEGEVSIIQLASPLSFRHWGETETYDNGKGLLWTLDERAEVFNLNRSIVIASEKDQWVDESIDARRGGHMIVMEGGAAYIDNVEFFMMGQAGITGRYPFHWHLTGNVEGQYIRSSSIHKSFSRCVVIHQTSYATVAGNSCYDHIGHGFFLEDGNEVKNIIEGNIAALGRNPSQDTFLLISDLTGSQRRFHSTSNFWISHPDNYVRGNVAAGTEGTGFWMAFVPKTPPGVNPAANPLTSDTWVFEDNVAHSARIGFTHDGAPSGELLSNPRNPSDRAIGKAHYSPPRAVTFNDLVAYKCTGSGIYFRGDRVIYNNVVTADNHVSIWLAFDQEVRSSLVVGQSRNTPSQSGRYLAGLWIYDGPTHIENIHFANFIGSNSFAIDQVGAFHRYTNQWKGFTFSDTEQRIRAWGTSGWGDVINSASKDLDGSLTGIAGSLVLPDHPWNDDPRCRKGSSNEIRSIVCKYEVSYLAYGGNIPENGFTTIRTERRTGDAAEITTKRGAPRNKFSMISGNDYYYTVTSLPERSSFGWDFFSDSRGDSSPVVKFPGWASCTVGRPGVVSLPAVSSEKALQLASDASVYRSSTDLYVKFVAYGVRNKLRPDTFNGFNYYQFSNCKPPKRTLPPIPMCTNKVIGTIDSARLQANLDPGAEDSAVIGKINGWVCQEGLEASLDVDFYVELVGGEKKAISRTPTSVSSEGAIHNICKTDSQISHRFGIPITAGVVRKYGGRPIALFAIVKGGDNCRNVEIENRKELTVPRLNE